MRSLQRFLRTYQNLIVSVVMLVFVLVGFMFGVLPAAQKVLSIQKEVRLLSTQTGELSNKSAILSAVDEETYRRYLADLVTAVPGDQSLTSLFSTIDGLASQTGVSLTDLALTKPGALATESARKQSVEEKQIGTNLLPFAVTIIGSYDQIREFIALAVKVRRFFRIRGFDLSLIDPTNVSVRVAMDAYYSPYLTSIGSVDSKVEALNAQDEKIITTVSNLPLVGDFSLGVPSSGPVDGVVTIPKANPFAP